jgi:hypothetical protein
MNSEIEKKMLQKLKENLEKPKEDAFESNDVVDSLKDEFKQDIKKNDMQKPFSNEELNEDALEEELIDDEFKKSKEDFLESEMITKSKPANIINKKEQNFEENKEKIEQKLDNSQNESVIKPVSETTQAPVESKPLSETTQAPKLVSQEVKPVSETIQAPKLVSQETPNQTIPNTKVTEIKPVKKSSRVGIIVFFVILVVGLIAGIIFFL